MPYSINNYMNSLKITLWISAVGCLIAAPFTFLPWGIIENIFLWFGVEPIPNNLITTYLFRMACGVFALIGIFFIILAKNPFKYGVMLHLGAYGLIFLGTLCLILGLSLNMPLKLYIGDTLFGLVLGFLIVILSQGYTIYKK